MTWHEADGHRGTTVEAHGPGADDRKRLAPGAVTDAVRSVVEAWDGVTVHQHRFGGIEFRVGRRELGHLHPSFADLPFPRSVRDELVSSGRARPHHVLPHSGWVTVPMRNRAEVADVIGLLRQNYERTTHEEPRTRD